MSRRIAAGDVAGAHGAQNRALGFTLVLAAPFVVAFLTIPELIMAALFGRGAFDAAAAQRAGAVLAAYAVGLPAVVLIRSAVASFYARADTTTPVIAALTAVGVNVALKIVLVQPLGVVGLALATAIGAWINLLLLFLLAYRRDWTAPSTTLLRIAAAVAGASVLLALFVVLGRAPLGTLVSPLPAFRDEALLALLGVGGAAVYGVATLAAVKSLGIHLGRF
jgi:putative peptidoglycan lipid II flippase